MAGIKIEPRDDLVYDSGYASRKFWLTVVAMVLVVLTGLTAAFVPALGPVVSTVVGGLLGALGIYAGANVSTKFAAAGVKKTKKAKKIKKVEDVVSDTAALEGPPVEQG